jgi:hypothetical protein
VGLGAVSFLGGGASRLSVPDRRWREDVQGMCRGCGIRRHRNPTHHSSSRQFDHEVERG